MMKSNRLFRLNKKASEITCSLFFINLIFLILNRAIEALLLLQRHHFSGILKDVFSGLFFDLLLLSFGSVFIYFLVVTLLKIWRAAAWILPLILTFVYHLLHLPVLYFYIATLTLLDRLLLAHTTQEILFTVQTAGVNFKWVFVYFGIYATVFWGFSLMAIKYGVFQGFAKPTRWVAIFLALVFFIIRPGSLGLNSYQSVNIQTNKSVFFYQDLISHAIEVRVSGLEKQCITECINQYQQLFHKHEHISDQYPFTVKRPKENPWGRFFKSDNNAPSVVIIIVEGLNNDFLVSPDQFTLMPFLDSLKNESLYWDHFLGTGERSFAVLPSLIGSLPHGEIGFSMLDDMPLHLTLVNQLKSKGYHTAFFYGQGGYFHNKNEFLYRNIIDQFVDKTSYDDRYNKIFDPNSDYHWGYHDQDLFRNYFDNNLGYKTISRLDIFFTGTMHSPFVIDREEFYDKKYNDILESVNLSSERKAYYKNYNRFLRTLLFTDDALRFFFAEYARMESFDNTIFIITGDHPMTEVLVANPLKKYHVPLIVYSNLLKRPKQISSIASQFDVLPALVNLLEQNFGIDFFEYSNMFGLPADTSEVFSSNAIIPFMRGNRLVDEILVDNYFLSGRQLFQVQKGFELKPVRDEKVNQRLQKMLEAYNCVNNNVVKTAELVPWETFYNGTGTIPVWDTVIDIPFFVGKDHEYFLLQDIPISQLPGDKFYYYIRGLVAEESSNELPILVFDIRDEKDSILQWVSAGFELKRKKKQLGAFQYFNNFGYCMIENDEESHQKMLIYLWSKGSANATFNSLELKIFSFK